MQRKLEPILRDFHETDATALLELNAENRPEIGPLGAARLTYFASTSPYFKVALLDNDLVGFLMGTTDTHEAYDGPEFRWFADRHTTFAYVVRVALTSSARGRGLGPRLYHDFENWAIAANKAVLCTDVNTLPANPRSLRFHALFGFHEVGRTNPYAPDKEVAMFEKILYSPPAQVQ